MQRTSIYGIAIVLGLAGLASAQNPPLFESDEVRVIRALERPHVKGSVHQHAMNRVMVYLQGGSQDFDHPGGKKTTLTYKAGDVLWSPPEGMHQPELTTNDPVTIIELELKTPGRGKSATTAMDPLKVAPKNYKLEFENPQVRVFRAKFAPHETIAMHEHVLNRVGVYLTDLNTEVTTADGKVEKVTHKAGEVAPGGPVKHKEVNVSDKPIELVVVEFK